MSLKNKLIKAGRAYKCESCENAGEWQGKPLALQVDHIDGINSNNMLENLRFLCPNCHSQTSTFAGRNASKKLAEWRKLPIDEFVESIKDSFSIVEAISRLKLNPKNALIRAHVQQIIADGRAQLKNKNESTLIQNQILAIERSTIRFDKFGWVKEVSTLLEIEPQKVSGWMRRNMPSFYNDKCFKRKLS